MNFCKNCGAPVERSARFCSNCGHSITAPVESSHSVTAPHFHCPNCKSNNIVSSLSHQESSGGAIHTFLDSGIGFSSGDSSTTYHYEWICQNCGLHFPDVTEIASEIGKYTVKRNSSIFLLIPLICFTIYIVKLSIPNPGFLYFLWITIPWILYCIFNWIHCNKCIENCTIYHYRLSKQCYD